MRTRILNSRSPARCHGKNFSILYKDESVELAPFYDLVSTTFWPQLDTKLSMKLGREYRLDHISREDLNAFTADIGVKPSLAAKHLESMLARAPEAFERLWSHAELKGAGAILDSIWSGWLERAEKLAGRT